MAKKTVRNLFHNQTNEIFGSEVYSVGLHPWHVNTKTLVSDLKLVRDIANNKQIIAIGEAGLDKKVDLPFEVQLKAFKQQIEIAHAVNKPMIIHCVKAYNEIYELKTTSDCQEPWLIHWFNASEQMGLQLISKGFYLSFGHMLFNETSKAFKVFTHLPIDYIFFETDDAGYGIDEIYYRASELLNMPLKELEHRIENNFHNFFGIEP